MKNFEHMTLDQLAEEDRRITKELAGLPEDAPWGASGHPGEQYDRFIAHDDDDAKAHAADEETRKKRQALEAEQTTVKELIQKRIQLERNSRKQQALDAAQIQPKTHEKDDNIDHGHGAMEEFNW